jgi:parallel beta-helix repeat protein
MMPALRPSYSWWESMRRLLPFALLASLAIVPVGADEGRIPVAGPTTINAPGHYILTRDIPVTSGTGILVNASRVTLDLNGHVLSGPIDEDISLIAIGPTARFVAIRNGHLKGGRYGILADSTVGISLQANDLEIVGALENGIRLSEADYIELVNSRIINTVIAPGLAIFTNTARNTSGRIEGNTVGGSPYCLVVGKARNMQIRNNVLSNCGSAIQIAAASLLSPTSGGNLVEGNSITGSTSGISLAAEAWGNLVIGNTLENNAIGIIVDSASNQILDNTIIGSISGAPCGGGICVRGPRNLIAGNLVEESSPGCGLRFFGAAAVNNAYRRNMLRNNAGGSVCFDGGGSATNEGGNIF